MGEQTDRAKGRVKEAAGDLTGDRDLQRKGKADRLAGEVKEKAGNVVDSVKDAVSGDHDRR